MAFVCKGSGYTDDSSFAPYTILAEPLAQREDRVLGAAPERGHPGTCYRAYSLKLAKRTDSSDLRPALAVLVSHGGGAEVWSLDAPYDGGVTLAAILAMPEAAQYGLLWMLYRAGSEAREQAASEVRRTWARAFVEKRIKVKRSKGAKRVEVMPLYTASASYIGEAPRPVPGVFRTPEDAFAAAKAAHPDAASVSAAPLPGEHS